MDKDILLKNKVFIDRAVAVVLIIIISVFVFYFRMYAISLPALDYEAKNEFNNEMRGLIREEVNSYYPGLPESEKNKIIKKEFMRSMNENKQAVNRKIKKKAQDKKSFYQNSSGNTYMFGIDSYYWLRLTKNLIKKGHVGDRVVGKTNHDDLIDMPIEDSLSKSIHLWMGKFIYTVYNFLKIDADPNTGFYAIPVIFSLLLAIFSFLITRMLCGSNIAAFFASLAINLCPMLLQRTTGEWFDTDIYNVFFPLVIFGAFMFVFYYKETIKRILGLVLFCVLVALYAGVWQGWWFIFDLLLICGVVYFLLEEADARRLRNNLFWLLSLFVFGLVSVWLYTGKESALSFIFAPKELIFALKSVPLDNWPNIFLTVAELRKISPFRLSQELGGLLVFFIAIFGALYFILIEKVIRNNKTGLGYFAISIWLGVLYYVSLNAIRFTILLIVPLGILFGLTIDTVIRKSLALSRKFSKQIHFLVLGLLVIMVYFLISFYVKRTYAICFPKRPMLNDSWHRSITYIKDQSSPDAYINSWWDYGHWYKAIGERRVLFDGKTQNSPIAFWMAKTLTTNNEEEALGILRMLNLSKNKSFDLLESFGFSHLKSVKILKDLAVINNKDKAEKYLKDYLDLDKINQLIPLLYQKEMPETYFIASYDLVAKMPAISLIGNWDFEKADLWINFSNKSIPDFVDYLKKERGFSVNDIRKNVDMLSQFNKDKVRFWISGSNMIDYRSLSENFKKEDDLMMFDNDVVLNLEKKRVFRLRGRNKPIGIPKTFVFIDEDGNLQERVYDDSNVGYSVLLLEKSSDEYDTILLDPELTKCMLVQMYFLKGKTLEYFTLAHKETTVDGNHIYVYKVNWPDFFKPISAITPYRPPAQK